MKTLNNIKSELKNKNLSIKNINTKIFLMTLGMIIFSEVSVTLMTAIPFAIGLSLFGFQPTIALIYVVCHFLFYVLYLKSSYKKEIQPSFDEIKLTIKALKEIKSEL